MSPNSPIKSTKTPPLYSTLPSSVSSRIELATLTDEPCRCGGPAFWAGRLEYRLFPGCRAASLLPSVRTTHCEGYSPNVRQIDDGDESCAPASRLIVISRIPVSCRPRPQKRITASSTSSEACSVKRDRQAILTPRTSPPKRRPQRHRPSGAACLHPLATSRSAAPQNTITGTRDLAPRQRGQLAVPMNRHQCMA